MGKAAKSLVAPSIFASKQLHDSPGWCTSRIEPNRGSMAWNSHAPKSPKSSKAELREMAEKAVASWGKPIARTPAQTTTCPNCGHRESITVHWARCPRCGARK
jgi:hypothetical protein